MKKILLLAFLIVPTVMFGQSNIQVFRAGSGSSTNSAAVASQISDSLENLTLGVDIATSADSVLVMDDGKLKVMSKAEFLSDIYSALNQMSGLDLIAPTIDSIEIGRYNDSILVAFFHESDTHIDSIPPISAFNLTEGGVTVGLDTILFSATGDSMLVVMNSLAEYGLTYLFDYTKAYKHVQDSSGNDLANFSDMAVINYVSEPGSLLGEELILNGSLSSSDSWEVGLNMSIGSGVATYSHVDNHGTLTQNVTLETSTTYQLEFDIVSASTMTIAFQNLTSGAIYIAPDAYSTGHYTLEFTTPSDLSPSGFVAFFWFSSLASGTIDNISIKEVI